jgi:predicted transcriptional regulator
MIRRVSWFSKIDYFVIDFFDEYDLQVSPKVLAENIDYHPEYVGRRLRALRDVGLLKQHDNGLYALSNLGREFLAGEVPIEEIEALDPDNKG